MLREGVRKCVPPSRPGSRDPARLTVPVKPSESGTISTFQTDSKLRKSHVRELTEAEKNDAGKEIDHDCPKCGNPKMNYYEVQLRSADEGSTIFYHCPKCGHR